jgi:hypothetical protein
VSSDETSKRARRRRAERLLGDLVPETTGDESDEGWSEQDDDSRDDDLRRDVPPHHG